MNNRKLVLSTNGLLYNIIGVIYLLELFVKAPIEFGGFKIEWPYISSGILLIYMMTHKSNRDNRYLTNPLYLFFAWCFMLAIFSTIRFNRDIYFPGLLHMFRMFIMFAPYIWILKHLNNYERLEFYKTLRAYFFASLIALLALGMLNGGISNSLAFSTLGVGKNSLGYTVVCIALLFSAYENKAYLNKIIPPYIWLSICVLVCIFTKSGTAVAFIIGVALIFVLRNTRVKGTRRIALILFCTIIAIGFLNIDLLIRIFNNLHVYKLSEFFYSFKYGEPGSFGQTTDVRLATQLGVLQEFGLDMAVGRFYYYYYSIHGFTAHQLYLQILYDTGIIGIVAFIVFCARNVLYSRNRMLVFILLAYSFVEVFLIQYPSLLTLALLTSAIVSDNEKEIPTP